MNELRKQRRQRKEFRRGEATSAGAKKKKKKKREQRQRQRQRKGAGECIHGVRGVNTC